MDNNSNNFSENTSNTTENKENVNKKIDENNDIDDFDKNFDQAIQNIKARVNENKLSEDFKEKLQEKLDFEYSKPNEKITDRLRIPFKNLAACLACFVLIFSTCFAFADEIESFVSNIFSNTDKIYEQAIKNGNYHEINMDYVKNNGVSIKVDYVVEEQDNLYIAFNIVTEEEYAKLYLDETIIKAKNRNNNENEYTNSEAVQKSKRISKYNYIIIYKFKIAKFNTDVVGLDVKANKIRVKTSNNIFKLINSECKFFIAI